MGALEHRLFAEGLRKRSGGKIPSTYPWRVVDSVEYGQYVQMEGVQGPSFRSCSLIYSCGVADHRAS